MATAEYITAQPMTRSNPDGITYRLPLSNHGSVRIDSYGHSLALFGDCIDKLGAYEKSGLSPSEVMRLSKLYGR